jgi:glutamate/tyrosine decarboxylase-like PLP-dependent enzyme
MAGRLTGVATVGGVDDSDFLRAVAERGIAYRASLSDATVTPTATPAELRASLGGPTPEQRADPVAVVNRMADVIEAGGLMGMDSGRFFGFVIGGSLPAALAADWLVTAWDQNTGLFAPSPATSVVEEIAGRWMLDLLGLPAESSFAFVTGGQMANTTTRMARVRAGRGRLGRRDRWAGRRTSDSPRGGEECM